MPSLLSNYYNYFHPQYHLIQKIKIYLLVYQDRPTYKINAIAKSRAKVPDNTDPKTNPTNIPIANKTHSAFLPESIFFTIYHNQNIKLFKIRDYFLIKRFGIWAKNIQQYTFFINKIFLEIPLNYTIFDTI